MLKQEDLFPEPATTVKVDPEHAEPSLWVRRLVVWETPDKVLRDVRLRRGLNIIWSPDPGAPAADLGRTEGTGHGAGKSLFCRLLRHCLGEETFANDQLRAKIGATLPDGLVGAEVVLAGVPWGVVRPLGSGRRVVVAEGVSPEQLLAEQRLHTGIGPLLAAGGDLVSAGIDGHIPGSKEAKGWLLALAWLTRDQECRFGHPLEWRHSAADTKSSMPAMSKEQLLLCVRLLLNAMSPDEISTRTKLDEILAKKQSKNSDIASLERDAIRLGTELVDAFGLNPVQLTADALAASGIRATAETQLREVEASGDALDNVAPELPALSRDLEETIRQIAVLREQQERADNVRALHVEQLKALRGERSNLNAEEIKARLGPVCPVCNVSIDQALAEGCGISHVFHDPAEITSERAQVESQIASYTQAIGILEQQARERTAIVQSLGGREEDLRRRIQEARERVSAARRVQQANWRKAARLADDTRRLEKTHADREEARRELALLAEREAETDGEMKAHRDHQRAVAQRVDTLFRYVCHGILGTDVDCSLNLMGDRFRADVPIGGVAMDSLKTIVFDLATLLMAVEGRAGLPAFLIHDSPREADLGLSLYYKLFRFVAKLEGLGSPPPFQYIITTTTEPPEELQVVPHLVLRLDGMKDQDRLLKRAL